MKNGKRASTFATHGFLPLEKDILHMFDENEDFLDLAPLLGRFETMLSENTTYFFDVDEFEAISEHYYTLGKVKKALKAVEVALEQHPAHPAFMMRRAQIYTSTNKIKEAHRELEKIASIEPESYDLFMARAALASKQEQFVKAINLYKKALPFAEYKEDVWPMIAVEYQMLGKHEEAIKYLKLTLKENPEDEIAIYNLSLCYDLLDKNEEGIRFFNSLIDEDPYNEVAWYHLGLLYFKVKEFDKSLRAIDYSILIDEHFTAAYYEKARVLERTFRYQEAAETYLQSFEYEGPTGFSFYKIGLCYLKLHKEDKAISYFTKAIHEDACLDEAYYELAYLYDEKNEFQQAVYNINKALDLDPENLEYVYTSARIHRRAGLLDEAEVLYDFLFTSGATEVDIFIDYAELLFDLCQFEEGMNMLYKGIQVNPKSAELHYRIAGYLFTLTEEDEAIIYFKKAYAMHVQGLRFFFQLFPKLKNNKRIRAAIVSKRQK